MAEVKLDTKPNSPNLSESSDTRSFVSSAALISACSKILDKINELPDSRNKTLLNEYFNHMIRLQGEGDDTKKITARMGQIEEKFSRLGTSSEILFKEMVGHVGRLGLALMNPASSEAKLQAEKPSVDEVSLVLNRTSVIAKRINDARAPSRRDPGIDQIPIENVIKAVDAAYKAGFRGEDLVTIVAIVGPESGYNSSNSTYGRTDNSHGFWQVNLKGDCRGRIAVIRNETGKDPVTALHDPEYNAKWAKQLYDGRKAQGQNPFRDWSAYNHGLHKPYEDLARRAVAEYMKRVLA